MFSMLICEFLYIRGGAFGPYHPRTQPYKGYKGLQGIIARPGSLASLITKTESRGVSSGFVASELPCTCTICQVRELCEGHLSDVRVKETGPCGNEMLSEGFWVARASHSADVQCVRHVQKLVSRLDVCVGQGLAELAFVCHHFWQGRW